LQCCNGEIELLPALPNEWPDGSITGLRAKGGFEVNITWKNGKLYTASLTSKCGNTARVRYSTAINVTLKGKPIEVTRPQADVVAFQTKAQQTYNLSAATE
jgi:alpha-L-fucosidase 2